MRCVDDKLYMAILNNDAEEIKRLKENGEKLSGEVVNNLGTGTSLDFSEFISSFEANEAAMARELEMRSEIWSLYYDCIKKADAKTFISVIRNLYAEIGAPLHYMMSIFQNVVPHLMRTPEVLDCVIDCFEEKRIKKRKMMTAYIDIDDPAMLEVCVRHGWINQPKKRDEMIEYAVGNKKAECAAYLIEYKNRTADINAEREKAEKKAERELNADPNSVSELRKIWRYVKLDDGTLKITCYKGNRAEIIVPARIGKDTVSGIGEGAFSGERTHTVRTPPDICAFRRDCITKVALPETIKFIDPYAFCDCKALREINVPLSVSEILCRAFCGCASLDKLELSGGVRAIEYEAFPGCPGLTVIVRQGSFAERYCKENNIRYVYRSAGGKI